MKLKTNRGVSTISALVIILLVLAMFGVGGYYFYKSVTTKNIDVPAGTNVLDGTNVSDDTTPSVSTNWSSNFCDYFTLADAQAVFGNSAKSNGKTVVDGCSYVLEGDPVLKITSKLISMGVVYRSLPASSAKAMYDGAISVSSSRDVTGVAEWAVLTNIGGNTTLLFYNKGSIGRITIATLSGTLSGLVSKQNEDDIIELAKRVIPKLP